LKEMEEKEKGRGRKGKREGRRRRWREGFGPTKHFGVAPPMA